MSGNWSCLCGSGRRSGHAFAGSRCIFGGFEGCGVIGAPSCPPALAMYRLGCTALGPVALGGAIVFVLTPGSGIPIYRQLEDQIKRLIGSGRLQPGDTLPSVRALAVAHAVNPWPFPKLIVDWRRKTYCAAGAAGLWKWRRIRTPATTPPVCWLIRGGGGWPPTAAERQANKSCAKRLPQGLQCVVGASVCHQLFEYDHSFLVFGVELAHSELRRCCEINKSDHPLPECFLAARGKVYRSD